MFVFRLGDINRPHIEGLRIIYALEGAEHANVADPQMDARGEILKLEMELLVKISLGDWGAGILRLSECKSRNRGRPPGRSLVECHLFVSVLLAAVEHAGGRLTFNKAYPDKGTLMPALRLLSERLPPGTIPKKKLPPSRIADICAASRRGIAVSTSYGTTRSPASASPNTPR
jgi:hypothetical protein